MQKIILGSVLASSMLLFNACGNGEMTQPAYDNIQPYAQDKVLISRLPTPEEWYYILRRKGIGLTAESIEDYYKLYEERYYALMRYHPRNNIGDKVCWGGRTIGFLINNSPETAIGFVENISGNQIKIRIASNFDGAIRNGVHLNKNTLIWDYYTTWDKCY